jgi:hypothetical protein
MRLIDMLPSLITLLFLSLLGAGLWIARKKGALYAYISFVWLIPLASSMWLLWGEDQLGFGYSILNVPFVLGVISISFLLAIIGLPLLIYLNWNRLSGLQIAGLCGCALLHGFPFFLYILIWVSVLIWGK